VPAVFHAMLDIRHKVWDYHDRFTLGCVETTFEDMFIALIMTKTQVQFLYHFSQRF